MTAAPPSASRPAVPVWLDRMAAIGWRVLVTSALGLVIALIAGILADVTMGIILALVVAAPLVPTVERLRRRGMSRSLASAAACVAGLLGLVVVVALMVGAFLPYLRELIDLVTRGLTDLGDALAAAGVPDWVIAAFDRVESAIRDLALTDLQAVVGDAVSVGTVLVLAGFLLFFLLQDGDRGWAWLTDQLESWQADRLTSSAHAGLTRVGAYVSRTVVLAGLDAVVAFVLLTPLGVPFTGPLVTVVFLLGFIPYLGGIVATLVVGLATQALVGLRPGDRGHGRPRRGRPARGPTARRHPHRTPGRRAPGPRPACDPSRGDAVRAVRPDHGGPGHAVRHHRHAADPRHARHRPGGGRGDAPGRPDWAVPFWLDRLAQCSWRALSGWASSSSASRSWWPCR